MTDRDAVAEPALAHPGLEARRGAHGRLLGTGYGDTNFITGMRAWAATMVVVQHAGGAGLGGLGAIGKAYARYGHVGVYVFYVISGFAIASAYKRSSGFGEYITHRFFRIAPLYYFWMAVILAFPFVRMDYWQHYYHASIDAHNILMHLAFLSGWEQRIANSLFAVEWSVTVETFWYCALPALSFLLLRGSRGLALIVAVAALFALTQWGPRLFAVDGEYAIYWAPPTYVFSFALGVLVEDLRARANGGWRAIAFAVGLAVLALYPFAPQGVVNKLFDEIFVVSAATALLLLGGGRDRGASRALFENPIAQHVGVVSYGVYLIHMSFLATLIKSGVDLQAHAFWVFVYLWGGATLTATALHYAIERPGIRLGRRLGERFARFSTRTAVAASAVPERR
ncbi:MAG: acyltransferase family protein [Roseiarcus sp.]